MTTKRWASLLLQFVYPTKCALCGRLGAASLCTICLDEFQSIERQLMYSSKLSDLDYYTSLYLYEGRTAQAIRFLKYRRITSLTHPLSHLILEGVRSLGLLNIDAIVPVPIHWYRKFERGFNQSELLCHSLPKEKIMPRLLWRSRMRRPQATLETHERLQNLKNCFKASPKSYGKSILLIDDVITSGGTAQACAETLKKAGAMQVGILALAGSGYKTSNS